MVLICNLFLMAIQVIAILLGVGLILADMPV